mmetsp:Transcript_19631/g.42057  ORF Transcript_19631/g.42057 Transcript_19631/m.42057 type:complete len:422 (+) Transcript_19631:67-1332(+)
MTIADGNVGAAIGVVCAAGASTAIGAAVVFFPSLVKRASRRVLAASLGLSAGVMVYVSFVEIFFKSVHEFEEAGVEHNRAYIYATLNFFGGVLTMKIVDSCVRRLSRDNSPRRRHNEADIEIVWNEDEDEDCQETNGAEQVDISAPHCFGCSNDPLGELEEWHEMAELELEGKQQVFPLVCPKENSISITWNEDEESNKHVDYHESNKKKTGSGTDEVVDRRKKVEEGEDPSEEPKTIRVIVENVPRPQEGDGLFRTTNPPDVSPKEEKRKLVKLGLSTAIAITLHNFPEGLATFVAALDDPSIGGVLAIAIGIHNIPEGLCVALPIYYATGNRWKAFMWGCFSGISEPIAAILGWLVLAKAMTDNMYAILFGFVSGMMIVISFRELIPTAHRYDPGDAVVTNSILIGMSIMAVSLILFKF